MARDVDLVVPKVIVEDLVRECLEQRPVAELVEGGFGHGGVARVQRCGKGADLQLRAEDVEAARKGLQIALSLLLLFAPRAVPVLEEVPGLLHAPTQPIGEPRGFSERDVCKVASRVSPPVRDDAASLRVAVHHCERAERLCEHLACRHVGCLQESELLTFLVVRRAVRLPELRVRLQLRDVDVVLDAECEERVLIAGGENGVHLLCTE
mmetsp:Transcript_7770/g.20016  ORF Transcript_7770/g.20016 Transcript_7770/m.20016 type:complete len:209 (-) Transcript_7770:409-1035(-)